MSTKLLSFRLLDISQRLPGLLISRNYAKPLGAVKGKGKGKAAAGGQIQEKIVLPVEKDANKLVNYVCGSNILVDGEDVKLKPESEYPDWLWDIHIGPPKTLDELDPNTKEYWKKVRKQALTRNNKLAKLRRF